MAAELEFWPVQLELCPRAALLELWPRAAHWAMAAELEFRSRTPHWGTRVGNSPNVVLTEGPNARGGLPADGTHRKKPLESIPENEPPSSSGARSSRDAAPSASGLPGNGNNDMNAVLQFLGNTLQRNARFDKRGLRSALRRNLRFQLRENNLPLPDWLDDDGTRLAPEL